LYAVHSIVLYDRHTVTKKVVGVFVRFRAPLHYWKFASFAVVIIIPARTPGLLKCRDGLMVPLR
jgi:hypothetical protein